MALHIRNPEAESLARALAAETGESLNDAVVNALRERLERVMGRRSDPRLREDLGRIRNRFRTLPVLDDRTADEVIGYDEHGLPT